MGGATKWQVSFIIFINLFRPVSAKFYEEVNDLAVQANVSSSSTCGWPPSISYIIDDSYGAPTLKSVICDSTSGKTYNATNLVDSKSNTWWQSKNDPGEVNIDFSFPESTLISEVIVEPGPLPFASIWTLEKSEDGVQYSIIRKFIAESELCNKSENAYSFCIRRSDYLKPQSIKLPNCPFASHIRISLKKVHALNSSWIIHDSQLYSFYTLRNVKILQKLPCQLDKELKKNEVKPNGSYNIFYYSRVFMTIITSTILPFIL